MGNFDGNTPVYNGFMSPIETNGLRIMPLEYEAKVSMRVGIMRVSQACKDRGGTCVGLGPVEPVCACGDGKFSLLESSQATADANFTWNMKGSDNETGFTLASWVRADSHTEEYRPLLQCIDKSSNVPTAYKDQQGFVFWHQVHTNRSIVDYRILGDPGTGTRVRAFEPVFENASFLGEFEHMAFTVQPTGQVTDVANFHIIYDVMVTIRFYRGGVLTATSDPMAWRSYSTDRAYTCTILPRNSSISPIFTDSTSHTSDNVDGEFHGSLMSTYAWQGVLSEAEIAETMKTSMPKHTSHQTTCMPLPLGGNTGGVCSAEVPCSKKGFQKKQGTTPGDKCRDFDECSSDNTNNCHESASCTNIGGGFKCECNQGFVGNGTTCQSAADSSAAPSCGSSTTPGYICQCSNSVSTCQDNNEVNQSLDIGM